MSLELLEAHQTARGISVTFATDRGVELLEGSHEEVARLASVMQQVGALAALNDSEHVWLEEVTVGDAVVRLGLRPGRQARVRITRS
jgi:DNA-binding IclR family transcriptional regulator